MKILPFIFIVLLTFPLRSYSDHSSDRVFLASTLPYPPYQYQDPETGEPKGFAIEVIEELFQRTGNGRVVFEFYPWKRAVHLTESGQSDLLFNAGKNEARREWGLYVDSTLILQQYHLFKLKEKPLFIRQDFNDAADLSIAVRAGYLYGNGPFRQALDQKRFSSIHYSDSTEQSVQMLLHGRVDIFVGDYMPVNHYLEKHQLTDQIDVVQYAGEPVEVLRWPTYILLSKKNTDEALVDQLYRAMEEMKQDGTYQAIFERYRK